MEAEFSLKPQFDRLMFEAIPFLSSVSLSELMRVQNGSKKEDYDRLKQELRKAIQQSALEKPDFFLYATMGTNDYSDCLTFSYYRGCLESFGISPSEFRAYAEKYDFNVPPNDGFAMTVLVLMFRVTKIMGVESIGHPSGEKLAVLELTGIVDKNLKVFLTQVKGVL